MIITTIGGHPVLEGKTPGHMITTAAESCPLTLNYPLPDLLFGTLPPDTQSQQANVRGLRILAERLGSCSGGSSTWPESVSAVSDRVGKVRIISSSWLSSNALVESTTGARGRRSRTWRGKPSTSTAWLDITSVTVPV
ncbi:hypothetical protein M514_11631 [Trichuris suis]|uniref:Uncharacterized protein n=1 Tax=Trichuris suis TaxID=68888 RepID=A0A085N3A0_9BILA|nr:hypothetical protein M514_11631 [Trichuris suis]